MRTTQKAVRALGHLLLPAAEHARLSRLPVDDAGHGFDVLGMNRDFLLLGAALARPLHRHYFRVTAHGADSLPSHGACILVANHSGMIPFDAAMLCFDVVSHTEPPRMPRTIADFFVPQLPTIGTLLSRMGMSNGTPSNVNHLVQSGEMVLIFPEGMQAIGKPPSERYRIAAWRVGHAELALRYGVPVVPIAIIGPEEQWREAFRIRGFHAFGAPYLPVPASPLPLPVHYHIHYGEPLTFGAAERHPSPERVERAAASTRAAVEALIERGLATRKGVFL